MASVNELFPENDISKRYEEGVTLLDQLEQIWQNKSEFENKFHRLSAILATLKQQQQANPQAPIESAVYVQQQKAYYDQWMRLNPIATALEQKAIKSIETYVIACENLCSSAGSYLEKWKWQQKSQQYGVPLQNEQLLDVTKRYQHTMEHTFAAWRLLSRFANSRSQVHQSTSKIDPQLEAYIQALYHRAQAVLESVIRTSFVITSQPPMVVKNKIKFEATLLAAIDKLGLEAQSIQMSVRIVSEETAADLKQNPKLLEQKIPTVGQIDNSNVKSKALQRLSINTLGFELKNIKVTVESRKQATKTGEAIMKKYYFLCTTEIKLPNRPLQLHLFSLPFMVSVHGTQDVELYARAFWDTAFSKNLDSIPLVGESQVRWRMLGPAVEAVFSVMTRGHRRLSSHDVEYLKYRLYNGCPSDADPAVSWQQFYKDRLDRIASDPSEPRKRCQFSFWEWLFRIGDMIQEKSGRDTGVSEMWEEGYIEGFISKQEAESKLLQAPEPTMLIRFSENQTAGLSIVFRDPYTHEIEHLTPFRFKEEIEKLTLPVMVVSCDEVKEIQYIYPDKPRSRIQDKVDAGRKVTIEEQEITAYKQRTLVMISNGEKLGNRTPSYIASPSPAYVTNSSRISTATASSSINPFQAYHSATGSSPAPSQGFMMSMDTASGYSQMSSQWDPNHEDLDNIQSILQDLGTIDDDYDISDSYLQMIQTFDMNNLDTAASPQQQAFPNGFGATASMESTSPSSGSNSYEFEML